jgi:hypothetical protein
MCDHPPASLQAGPCYHHWNAAEARWILVDAQIDELQRAKLHPDFDLLDVPRDRFVIAGDAWV